MIKTSPEAVPCQKEFTPPISRRFVSVPRKRTPITVPVTPPCPPENLVPPRRTAASELSSAGPALVSCLATLVFRLLELLDLPQPRGRGHQRNEHLRLQPDTRLDDERADRVD